MAPRPSPGSICRKDFQGLRIASFIRSPNHVVSPSHPRCFPVPRRLHRGPGAGHAPPLLRFRNPRQLRAIYLASSSPPPARAWQSAPSPTRSRILVPASCTYTIWRPLSPWSPWLRCPIPSPLRTITLARAWPWTDSRSPWAPSRTTLPPWIKATSSSTARQPTTPTTMASSISGSAPISVA